VRGGEAVRRESALGHGPRRGPVPAAFFFQAEDGIRDGHVTGVQTCALPISLRHAGRGRAQRLYHATDLVRRAVEGGGADLRVGRSEERRVGKEGGARGWTEHNIKNIHADVKYRYP